MQLHPIDKAVYQHRHKRVVIALIAALTILSLTFSSLLIAFYGSPEDGSNTALNAAGVLLAVAVLLVLGSKLKHKPYFAEVLYVWQLKQELNQINRRISKIKVAAEQGDSNAMVILNYCYKASEQLWQLENNTLVMEELHKWMADLELWQKKYNVQPSLEDYQRELLSRY
ncbi:MAG: DUF3087 domain-containing protein [Candidatus Pelagadaptatus aseana]|uniref:DUF3087 family protein n=1 Tax=Candidatus Pelagadaptatus aseana TaxID=3120508 RepID=UPI0039B1F13F